MSTDSGGPGLSEGRRGSIRVWPEEGTGGYMVSQVFLWPQGDRDLDGSGRFASEGKGAGGEKEKRCGDERRKREKDGGRGQRKTGKAEELTNGRGAGRKSEGRPRPSREETGWSLLCTSGRSLESLRTSVLGGPGPDL